MTAYRTLVKGDVLPASFIAALQEFVGSQSSAIDLTLANGTTVSISAGAGNAQAAVGIGGLWRYRSSSITASVSGAAGEFDVFVVASDNSFSNTPAPDTDNTDYTFGLVVLASGATPSGTYNGNAIVQYRKIGELTWDGTKVVSLRQMVGSYSAYNPLTPKAPTANVTPLTAVGAASQAAALIRARIGVTGTDVFSVSASGAVAMTGALTGVTDITMTGNLTGISNSTGTGSVVLATSPTLAGTPTAPTQPSGNNSTRIATTAFVADALASGLTTTTLVLTGTAPKITAAAISGASRTSNVLTFQVTGETNPQFQVSASGSLFWGPGGATATDVTLARAGVSTLLVTGQLSISANLVARSATGGQVKLGDYGPASEAAAVFGSAADTNLYRSAAGVLKTDGSLRVAGLTVSDATDVTKNLTFSIAGVTTGTTRTLTVPNASGTIALISDLTSGYQPINANLTALGALGSAGVMIALGANTFTSRTLTGSAGQITVSNGDGVAGNPTIALPATITSSQTFSGPLTFTSVQGLTLAANYSSAEAIRATDTEASGSSSGGGISLFSDDGAALVNGDRLGFLAFGGSKDAAHTVTSTATIIGYATEAWGSAATGSELRFSTTPNGSTSRAARVIIPNNLDGFTFGSARDTNLYRNGANSLTTDGAFNAGGNSTFASKMQVIDNGTIAAIGFIKPSVLEWTIGTVSSTQRFTISNDGALSGTGVYLTNGGTTWNVLSDARAKNVLGLIEDPLDKIAMLNGVYFNYKTDAADAQRRVGLIAQDVQRALPEAVDTSDPDEWGVGYTDLIPLLVAGIQQQQAQINELKELIA